MSRLGAVDCVGQSTSTRFAPNLQAYMDGTPGFQAMHPSKGDDYLRYASRTLFRNNRDAILELLTSVVEARTGDECCMYVRSTSQEKLQAMRERGVASGHDVHKTIRALSVCHNPWVAQPSLSDILGVEGQLVRAIIFEGDSIRRLYLVSLWSYVSSFLGLHEGVRAVLSRADGAASVFRSATCDKLYALYEYYFAHRRLHNALNVAWDRVILAIFSARSVIPESRDLTLCMWHPAYSCTRDTDVTEGDGDVYDEQEASLFWEDVPYKKRFTDGKSSMEDFRFRRTLSRERYLPQWVCGHVDNAPLLPIPSEKNVDFA